MEYSPHKCEKGDDRKADACYLDIYGRPPNMDAEVGEYQLREALSSTPILGTLIFRYHEVAVVR